MSLNKRHVRILGNKGASDRRESGSQNHACRITRGWLVHLNGRQKRIQPTSSALTQPGLNSKLTWCGLLAMALEARQKGRKRFLVPGRAVLEASVVASIDGTGAQHLGGCELSPWMACLLYLNTVAPPRPSGWLSRRHDDIRDRDIHGRWPRAKNAL